MKFFKFTAVAILMAMATSASAQFVDDHASFYVQYNSLGVGDYAEYLDDADADADKLSGLTVGFNKAISVTSSLPLFVEFGAGLTYAWANFFEYDEGDDCGLCDDEYSITGKVVSEHMMVNVPINLIYKFQLPNSSITIEPYVGLNLKAHLLGKMKTKYSYEACCDDVEEILEEEFEDLDEDDMTVDYFDKKDMGGKKYVGSRLNYGWQIGANVDFGSAFAGISYGSDLNKFMEYGKDDWTFSAFNVTVGVRF